MNVEGAGIAKLLLARGEFWWRTRFLGAPRSREARCGEGKARKRGASPLRYEIRKARPTTARAGMPMPPVGEDDQVFGARSDCESLADYSARSVRSGEFR